MSKLRGILKCNNLIKLLVLALCPQGVIPKLLIKPKTLFRSPKVYITYTIDKLVTCN